MIWGAKPAIAVFEDGRRRSWAKEHRQPQKLEMALSYTLQETEFYQQSEWGRKWWPQFPNSKETDSFLASPVRNTIPVTHWFQPCEGYLISRTVRPWMCLVLRLWSWGDLWQQQQQQQKTNTCCKELGPFCTLISKWWAHSPTSSQTQSVTRLGDFCPSRGWEEHLCATVTCMFLGMYEAKCLFMYVCLY